MSHDMLLAASWLLTVALHGGAALAIVYAFDRSGRLTRTWREALWRCALFGGALTATLQLALAPSPFGPWRVATARPVVAESATHPIVAPPVSSLRSTSPQDARTTAAPDKVDSAALPAIANAPVVAAHPQLSAPSHIPVFALSALIGLWLAGAAIALVRLLVGMHRLRRSVAGASPWPETDPELCALACRAGAGDARFFSLDAIPSPMAVPGRRIIVPLWAIESLDWRQLRAMLAHELAHLARRDPQWKIAICAWRALFWFMPFAGIAQRRLDEIAELTCDAWAARQTGDAHSVAQCLAACAEYRSAVPMPSFAPAMAVHRSLLMRRVDTLLDGDAVRGDKSGLIARCLAATTLLAGMYALPAVTLIGASSVLADQAEPSPPSPPAPPSPSTPPTAAGGHGSSHVSEVDILGWHTTSLSVSGPTRSLRAEIHGQIAFTPDETDVASLDAGGTAMFQETVGGSTRRIELSEDKGQLKRHYFVNGSERAYDADAHTWFAALVPSLIRESGLGAEARVARLYDKGGANAVLDEIERIQSGYARGVYLKLLTAHGKLAPGQIDRAMRIAGDLDGDYEKQQALQNLFATQSLDAAEQIAFFHQVTRVGGNYEKSELLSHSVDKLVDDAAVRSAWLAAAASVSGDYEHARSLKAILALGKLNDAQLGEVVASSASIGGDYEHAEVLKAAITQAHDVNAIAPAVIRSAQKIGGAYERSQTLLALIRAGKLDRSAADEILDSASSIGADYETSQVLIALAHAMPNDPALVKHYRVVASHLSEYERGQAESALPL